MCWKQLSEAFKRMEQYPDYSGHSGIAHFSIGADFIAIKFSDRERVYIYSYRSAGKEPVETMKMLAKRGLGLNTYLNQHVRDFFE